MLALDCLKVQLSAQTISVKELGRGSMQLIKDPTAMQDEV